MRFCQLTSDYIPYPESGIGVHVSGLVGGLIAHGDRATVVTRKPGRPRRERQYDGSVEVLNGPAGETVDRSPEGFMADQLAHNHTMHRELAEVDVGFDVIHNHSATSTPLAIALAETHGADLVTSVHIPDVTIARSGVPRPQWLDRHVMRALEIEGYRRSRLILSPSRTTTRLLTEEYPWCADRVVTLELPRPAKVAVKPTYQIKTPPRILVVSRVAPYKGLEHLVRALGKLGTGTVSCRIVGHGRGTALEELVARHGADVEFVGKRTHDEVLEELPEADILIAPSPMETYNLVVQEAMSAGLPVIASDIPVISERIRHERNGLLVPLSYDDFGIGPEVGSMAAAIRRLASDHQLRRRLGLAAREHHAPSTSDYITRLHGLLQGSGTAGT